MGKKYKYEKAKTNHEVKLHSAMSETPSMQQQPMEQKEVRADPRYNYASARLSIEMMILNFEDAVKDGDGERITRCWKFMTFIFTAYKSYKVCSCWLGTVPKP